MTATASAPITLPEEVTRLVDFARSLSGGARMAALQTATHAGVMAKAAGLELGTDNPFDRAGETDLAHQYAKGLEFGRAAIIPAAKIPHMRMRHGTTHAARSARDD